MEDTEAEHMWFVIICKPKSAVQFQKCDTLDDVVRALAALGKEQSNSGPKKRAVAASCSFKTIAESMRVFDVMSGVTSEIITKSLVADPLPNETADE